MLSNQILQNTITGIKNIAHTELCVFDGEGRAIATTVPNAEKFKEFVVAFAASEADSQVVNGYQFFKIVDETTLEYVLVVEGTGDVAYTVGQMASYQLSSLLTAYKERYDRDNFVKNLLLDNLLLVDIYSRAKKLHIETNARRCTFVIEAGKTNSANVLDSLKNTFGSNKRDFISAVDEKNTILVKELANANEENSLDSIAAEILKTLEGDNIKGAKVAYGTVVQEIREVSKSYKEAKMALDVGKIFKSDKDIVAYSQLGIGRLIYQLPLPLCRMFIKEIFNGRNPDELDEETLMTINKFFENSLNVSETSRQLYIHRNTLVYRIDKLQKTTGLDLRVFDDAITFKIALMVGKYMKYMEKQDY